VANGTTTIEKAGPDAADLAVTDARFDEFTTVINEPDLLAERRRAAWDRYRELPAPTRRSEEWRYTDLSRLALDSFRPSTPTEQGAVQVPYEELPAEIRDLIEHSHGRAGVFVQRNGACIHHHLEPDLAERGVVLASLTEAASSHPELLGEHLFGEEVAEAEAKLWSLHAAFLTGGYLLYVPKNVEVELPLHVFRIVDDAASLVSVHSLVVAEPGAVVTCIDEYLSPDLEEPMLSLAGAEIVGQASADIHYVSLQRYGRGVQHFGIQHVTAHRDTVVNGFNVTLGGDLTRADVSSWLRGPGSESEMLALWFGDRDQHIDHHTLQHHVAPHARSDLLYKGALTDEARSVFRGLIRVNPGAQLTDAYQTNRNLLLSETSNATALPNLEIEADDVRCSHGATIGQVEERQMFYLMSRGLTKEQAERLLVIGFFDEVLSRLPVEGVRVRVREAIERKLGL
jgi:Fe-S cluster assembly protein SufD